MPPIADSPAFNDKDAMRVLSIVSIFGLASCADQTPLDCGRFQGTEALTCVNENAASGDKAALLACFPFSKPETIVGVWVVGFEKNDFFEGQSPKLGDLLAQTSGTELLVDPPVPSDAPYEALEVEMIGRRSMCEFTSFTPHLIVVDELKVKRRTAVNAR